MSADIGATGSSHASQFSDPAQAGPEEATVIRSPAAAAVTNPASDSHQAFDVAPNVQRSTTPTGTLKRLFDTEQSVFGLRLDDFLLEEPIGTGGMGAVFRAHDGRLSRKVALKVLSPKACTDSKLIDRFHNEARAAARLSHDNIARVYSSGEDLGVHYIAYELIDGINLRDLIRQQGTIRIADALSYSIQIAMALNHTFAEGVVHRDIKPSNVIITPEGRARVVDLGLARRDGEDSIADLTVAGSTLGTFDYISPEQAQDPRKVDIRSDVYSLGCTMFHMLTGQPPYPEGTALQKLLDHKGKDAPSPIQVNKKVPRDLSAVVHRMMASDPAERHSTPAGLVEDLLGIANRMGLRGIQPEGLEWMRSRETRPPLLQAHFGWILAAGLLLLGVIALRLQPHTLETNSVWSGLRAALPEPSGSDGANSNAETVMDEQQYKRGEHALYAFGGSISELFWPNEKSNSSASENVVAKGDNTGNISETNNSTGEDAPPGDEPAQDVASSLGGMFADLATAMRDSIARNTSGLRMSGTDVDDASASGSTPLITLRSDPENPYTTLEAACWAAKDGDVVEIRPDRDNTPLVEKPIRIVKKRLTIRGVEVGGRVPLIRFDVGADDTQSHMITVFAGDVRLSNVQVQLITRDDVAAESWALCAFEGSDQVQFENVTIDVPNEVDQPTAIFDVTLGGEAAMARMNDEGGDYQVKLTNCFIRGNCNLFQIESPLPGTLNLTDTAISITGALLDVAGTNETLFERDRIDLEISHATCLLGRGILRMNDLDVLGGLRKLLPVKIDTENNIFGTSDSAPLIRMQGLSAPVEFRALLTWDGQQNLYNGFDVFWEVDSSAAALGTSRDTFEDWKANWIDLDDGGERGAMEDLNPWLSDRWKEKSLTKARLSDLQVDDTLSDVVGAAPDGSDLGAPLGNLRRVTTGR